MFLGNRGYDATMLADVPPGFRTAISEARFAAALPVDRAQALAALAEIDDPRERGVDTLQCVSCHVSTPLSGLRAGAANRYTSQYDLSIDGGASRATNQSLRAFGWLLDQPMISQRVVNESAQVLTELAACPAP